jgi:hypothetical protein
MAIMLILTLTISAFNPADTVNGNFKVAGDYSAVFPLLVVSVFVSLMVSRQTIFYKTQRSRGDIMAVPEVLCEPGMEGRPVVVDYDMQGDFESYGSEDDRPADYGSDVELAHSSRSSPRPSVRTIDEYITQSDIERAFEERRSTTADDVARAIGKDLSGSSGGPLPSPLPPSQFDSRQLGQMFELPGVAAEKVSLSSTRLDELLGQPMELPTFSRPPIRSHRRTQSAPVLPPVVRPGSAFAAPHNAGATSKESERKADEGSVSSENKESFLHFQGNRQRSNSVSSRGSLVRVNSFGEVHALQPSLLDQARMRSASSASESMKHRRVPSLPSIRHSRKNSDSSAMSSSGNPSVAMAMESESGALSLDDFEKSFNTAVNSQFAASSTAFAGRSPWTDNGSSAS